MLTALTHTLAYDKGVTTYSPLRPVCRTTHAVLWSPPEEEDLSEVVDEARELEPVGLASGSGSLGRLQAARGRAEECVQSSINATSTGIRPATAQMLDVWQCDVWVGPVNKLLEVLSSCAHCHAPMVAAVQLRLHAIDERDGLELSHLPVIDGKVVSGLVICRRRTGAVY